MGPIGGLKRDTCKLRVKERSKADNRVSVRVHGAMPTHLLPKESNDVLYRRVPLKKAFFFWSFFSSFIRHRVYDLCGKMVGCSRWITTEQNNSLRCRTVIRRGDESMNIFTTVSDPKNMGILIGRTK